MLSGREGMCKRQEAGGVKFCHARVHVLDTDMRIYMYVYVRI